MPRKQIGIGVNIAANLMLTCIPYWLCYNIIIIIIIII